MQAVLLRLGPGISGIAPAVRFGWLRANSIEKSLAEKSGEVSSFLRDTMVLRVVGGLV
jgi:hypothetical protein